MKRADELRRVEYLECFAAKKEEEARATHCVADELKAEHDISLQKMNNVARKFFCLESDISTFLSCRQPIPAL